MGIEGTIVAIAGIDFALIATSSHFNCCSHLLVLTPKSVLGTIGSFMDIAEQNRLMREYVDNPNNQMMTTDVWRHKITTVVYSMRRIQHSNENVLVGLDNYAKGCIYVFNRIGKSNPIQYLAIGYAKAKLQAVLETLIGYKKIGVADSGITKEWATEAVEQMFTSVAAEGYLGKSLTIKIVTRSGIEERTVQLQGAKD